MEIIDHWKSKDLEHQIIDIGEGVLNYRYRLPDIGDTWMNAPLPDPCLMERIVLLKKELEPKKIKLAPLPTSSLCGAGSLS